MFWLSENGETQMGIAGSVFNTADNVTFVAEASDFKDLGVDFREFVVHFLTGDRTFFYDDQKCDNEGDVLFWTFKTNDNPKLTIKIFND